MFLRKDTFAATPMAPQGTKVVTYIDDKARDTWVLNMEVGWYVGTSLNHSSCIETCLPQIRTKCTCKTVTFFLHSIPFLQVNLNDYLKQAARDIIQHLTALSSKPTLSLQAGDPVCNALLDIAAKCTFS